MTNDKLNPCEVIERFSRCEKDVPYVYWIHCLRDQCIFFLSIVSTLSFLPKKLFLELNSMISLLISICRMCQTLFKTT